MGIEDSSRERELLTDVVIKKDNTNMPRETDLSKDRDDHIVDSEQLTLLCSHESNEIHKNESSRRKNSDLTDEICQNTIIENIPHRDKDRHDCQISPCNSTNGCLCNLKTYRRESPTLNCTHRDSGHYSFQEKEYIDPSEYEFQHHRKLHKTKPFQKLTFFKSSLLITVGIIVGLVAMAVLYFSKLNNFSKMQDEITELKKSIKQLNDQAPQHSPLAVGSTVAVDHYIRPYAHLSLTAEDSIPLTPWNYRILQWNPTTTQNNADALQYNAISRSISVKEQGIYFVYNQIYIFRHNSRDNTEMNEVSNHTVFHSIYRKPYGYPSNHKPLTVTEGTISYCWDNRADKQVHTSYQAIIVELQEGDELLVGIEDFDDHLEMLVPKLTYFGLYRL